MRCGEYHRTGDKNYFLEEIHHIVEDVHSFLPGIHAAGVLHCDIRIRNILRFPNPFPSYHARYEEVDETSLELEQVTLSINTGKSIERRVVGEWQLVDFNIASIVGEESNDSNESGSK